MIPEGMRRTMERQHYRIVGNHSAVKICSWLKKSIRDEGTCYKERFYGIRSHRCLQMTPWILCPNRCLFCWRVIEKSPVKIEGIDEPKGIIDGCIEAQRSLLTGFRGLDKADKGKWREAQDPNQVAISLVGEPTIYPKIADLVEKFRSRGFTTFLVTNGQYPERLRGIRKLTNLYISLDAPDRSTYRRLDRPSLPDHWERLIESLDVMRDFDAKRVIRLTMVKGWNMKSARGYAELIRRAEPDFVEVKGYMFVGESRQRLSIENMPRHREIREFAGKLSKASGYEYRDEQPASRVVLLGR